MKTKFVYIGKSLRELIEEGKKEGCGYKSCSINISAIVFIGYVQVLPIVHKLYVEFSKEIEKVTLNKTQNMMSNDNFINYPLDKYLFRLVRYYDKWCSNKPSLNSGGCKVLIISKFYIEKLKSHVEDFVLNKFNIYNVIAVCVLFAAKFFEETLISTEYWAQVCGMTVENLINGEGLVLESINYDTYMSNEELSEIAKNYDIILKGPKSKPKKTIMPSEANFSSRNSVTEVTERNKSKANKTIMPSEPNINFVTTEEEDIPRNRRRS